MSELTILNIKFIRIIILERERERERFINSDIVFTGAQQTQKFTAYNSMHRILIVESVCVQQSLHIDYWRIFQSFCVDIVHFKCFLISCYHWV